jgi:hypothetical protein
MKLKTYFLVLLLGFFFSDALSQFATIGDNVQIDGENQNWNIAANWVNSQVPGNNASPITIKGTDNLLKIGDLNFNANGRLFVEANAYLELVGDLDAAAGMLIDVEPGGVLIITGIIKVAANGGIVINGDLQVSGFQVPGGGPNSATLSGNGTIHIPGGGTLPNSLNISDWSGTVLDGFLPVDLLSFTGSTINSGVELHWVTATEINNMGFEVQRLDAGGNWDLIGWVDGHYYYNGILEYHYQDLLPRQGVNYYRIRQVDYDGAYKFYGPVAVVYDPGLDAMDFKVFKNASSWHIALPGEEQHLVEVFDLAGRKLFSGKAVNNMSIPAPGQAVIVRVASGLNHPVSRVVM